MGGLPRPPYPLDPPIMGGLPGPPYPLGPPIMGGLPGPPYPLGLLTRSLAWWVNTFIQWTSSSHIVLASRREIAWPTT